MPATPEAALDTLDEISDEPPLQTYLPFDAAEAEADFYCRTGATEVASVAYHRAIQLAGNAEERKHFEKRLTEL